MSVNKDWNSGGANQARGQGSPNLRDLINALHGLADITALKALDASERSDGMFARVVGAGQQLFYKWNAASVLTGDDLLVLTPADSPAAGRWIVADEFFDLKLAIDFNKVDGAILYTMPAGFTAQLGVPWWEVTISWAGGASSAIGVSSSNAGLSTNGDLLGGASGDVAATLVSTGALAKGTVGAKIGKPGAVLQPADTIKFNRMTSAFTAGAGFVHVPMYPIITP